jgi:hypothetical protein
MPSKVRAAIYIALASFALVLTVGSIELNGSAFGFDFNGDLYTAAHAILHGANPYNVHQLQAEAAILREGGTFGYTSSPRYPPLLMLAVVPLSLLPFKVAAGLFMAICLVAVVGAMWLFGVRDWRCIAIATFSMPAVFGSWIGNVSTLLLLGTAIVWRLRDRLTAMPIAAAFVLAAKLFLWPLGLWMLVTRRYRQLALTALLTIAVTLAAWSVLGFAGLTSYPKLLGNVAFIGELRSSSLITGLLSAGVSTFAARAIALTLTAGLAGLAWRMSRGPEGDARAFSLMVVAALVASPVDWAHSFVLLFVPVALLSPRLSLLWFLPALANYSPIQDTAIELVLVAFVCAPLFSERFSALSRPMSGLARVGRAGSGSGVPASER